MLRGASGALLVGALLCACATATPPASSSGAIRWNQDEWRFLGQFRTQVPYTVRVAQDPAELLEELAFHGIVADPPAWDPEREIIAFFSEGIGSSCPELELAGVTIDRDARLVYGEFRDPLGPRACTADLVGAQTFVVGLARDRLPPSPFKLRLEADLVGCHPDCGSGPTAIEVRLH